MGVQYNLLFHLSKNFWSLLLKDVWLQVKRERGGGERGREKEREKSDLAAISNSWCYNTKPSIDLLTINGFGGFTKIKSAHVMHNNQYGTGNGVPILTKPFTCKISLSFGEEELNSYLFLYNIM